MPLPLANEGRDHSSVTGQQFSRENRLGWTTQNVKLYNPSHRDADIEGLRTLPTRFVLGGAYADFLGGANAVDRRRTKLVTSS